MGQVPNKEDTSIQGNRFIGVWYDLAGYPDSPYARSKLTITATNALTIQNYDDTDNLIKEFSGTVKLIKDKIMLSIITYQGPVDATFTISYVDYRGLSLLEREDGSEVRVLSRDAFLTKSNIRFLREKMESLDLEFDRLTLDESVIKG